MANEASIIELGPDGGRVVTRTCATAAAITKGTLMALTDPNTVAANTGTKSTFGGIASSDKSASDYAGTIGCYTAGTFDIWCSGAAIVAGNAVAMSGANLIRPITVLDDFLSGQFMGYAEEDGTTPEKIRVRLRGY